MTPGSKKTPISAWLGLAVEFIADGCRDQQASCVRKRGRLEHGKEGLWIDLEPRGGARIAGWKRT